MTDSAFFSGLVLLVLMALASVVERLAPLHDRSSESTRHLRVNLSLTVLALGGYALLYGGLLAAVALSRAAGIGLLPWLGIGDVAGAVVTIVALDLTTYLAHRSMHAVPALWRFHRVHHADSAVDATTSFRQHPFETIYRALALTAGAVLLGAAPATLVLYRTLSAINAVFEHANIRVPARLDALLALAFVSPNMHKIHHSRATCETDSNYGNLFSGFDRLFGSFVPTQRAFGVDYGLDGYDGDDVKTLSGVLWLPIAEPPSAGVGVRDV